MFLKNEFFMREKNLLKIELILLTFFSQITTPLGGT